MAKIEVLIPYILFRECGLPKKFLTLPLPGMFAEAKKSGYANDPADAGGHTVCGVTLSTYRTFRKGATLADLKNISFSDWRCILKKMYWDRWRADEINDQSVANMVVDWVWGSGRYGIVWPQRIVGVTADGIVGPATLSAINGSDPRALFCRLKEARHRYHESIINCSVARYAAKIGRQPTKAEKLRFTNYRFRNGWRRRVNGIVYGGFDYEA